MDKQKNPSIDISKVFLALSLLVFSLLLFTDHAMAANTPNSADSPLAAAAAAAVTGQDQDAVTEAAKAEDPSEAASDKISLDFKDADINTVLRVLSLKSHSNIVAGPEVQGTVTIRLDDVPWEKALEVVLRTYNYVYERQENIIRVTSREKMAQEPVITQTYVLNYTRALEIQDSTKDMLTERGRIRIAERTNTIIITDIPTNLYRIQEVIKKLDQRTPQAYIDSKIIKTDLGIAENMGIAWTPSATVTGSNRPTTFPFSHVNESGKERIADYLQQFFPFNTDDGTLASNASDPQAFPRATVTAAATYQYGTLNFSSFQAVLNMLKSRSNTKIVSNPRIVVLNNQKAKVQVGQQIPLPAYERNENTGSVEITGFNYRDIGVILNVVPHINSEEEILVELAPEVSSQGATVDFGEFQIPSFDVTIANTQVLIRSGETIAIGGLLSDRTQQAQSRIPYLSSIPVVGKAFRSKRQTEGAGNAKVETLFFITVTMVDTEGQPVGERLEKRMQKKLKGQVHNKASASNKTTPKSETEAQATPTAQSSTEMTQVTEAAKSTQPV